MSAEEELELEPQRVVFPEFLAVVVVVLHAELGEFRGIPREVRREAETICTLLRVECAVVSPRPVTAKASNDSRFDTPENLGIRSPILQRFGGQDNAWGIGGYSLRPLNAEIVALFGAYI